MFCSILLNVICSHIILSYMKLYCIVWCCVVLYSIVYTMLRRIMLFYVMSCQLGHYVVLQVEDLRPDGEMKRLFQRALRQTCKRCLRGICWRLEMWNRSHLEVQVHLADLRKFKDSCQLYLSP